MIPVPVNPEAIGDPNQTPVVYLGEGAAQVLGIPNRSAQPDPQTLDTEPPGRCAGCRTSLSEWSGGDGGFRLKAFLVCSTCLAAVAALEEARRERDEERRKVETLLVGDKALQARIWLGEEVQRLRAELEIVRTDRLEIYTRATQVQDELIAERERMRPVVEAARFVRRCGYPMPDDLAAAVDTYEKTQESTE